MYLYYDADYYGIPSWVLGTIEPSRTEESGFADGVTADLFNSVAPLPPSGLEWKDQTTYCNGKDVSIKLESLYDSISLAAGAAAGVLSSCC
jgi:hypothetical protein